MTAPDLDKLTASPHWEWRPGMRDVDGWIVVGESKYGDIIVAGDGPSVRVAIRSKLRPDLDHGGTQGEMLALVRKAWGPYADVEIIVSGGDKPACAVVIWNGRHRTRRRRLGQFLGESLGPALAAALLAAPRKGEP